MQPPLHRVKTLTRPYVQTAIQKQLPIRHKWVVAKWAPLIAEGQVIITAHGYVGVRAMPAKGGKHDLSVEGFSEALNYMINKSGGSWKTPDSKMIKEINFEISKRQKSISN